MTVIEHPVSDWEDDRFPMTATFFPVLTDINYIVIHYPGVPPGANHFNSMSNPAEAIRNGHQAYLTDPNRGYAYGYNWVIDMEGEVWTVRGWKFRNAANGTSAVPQGLIASTPNMNRHTLSIQVMVPNDSWEITQKQIEAVRYMVDQIRNVLRRKVPIIPHGRVKPTSCPGVKLNALILAGSLEPIALPPPPPTPTEEENEMIILDLNAATPQWTRFAYDAGMLVHVNGQANTVLDGIPSIAKRAITVDQLIGFINMSRFTVGTEHGLQGAALAAWQSKLSFTVNVPSVDLSALQGRLSAIETKVAGVEAAVASLPSNIGNTLAARLSA